MTTSGVARRSPDAQMTAMSADWPDFEGRKLPDGTLVWVGPLMPKARVYSVSILWNPGVMSLPYVSRVLTTWVAAIKGRQEPTE